MKHFIPCYSKGNDLVFIDFGAIGCLVFANVLNLFHQQSRGVLPVMDLHGLVDSKVEKTESV